MDWRTITDEKEKYAAYLCSREWGEKREAVRRRADNACERCLILPLEAVHHLTYARKYDESLEDLQGICSQCHSFIHGKSDVDPRTYTVALKVDADNSYRDGTSFIICPICFGNNVHLGKYESDESGTYWRETLHIFDAWCECNHDFQLCMATHKGNTYTYTREHKSRLMD